MLPCLNILLSSRDLNSLLINIKGMSKKTPQKPFSIFDNTPVSSSPIDYSVISQTSRFKTDVELEPETSKPKFNAELTANKIAYNALIWAVFLLVLNTISHVPIISTVVANHPVFYYGFRGLYVLFAYNIISGIVSLWRHGIVEPDEKINLVKPTTLPGSLPNSLASKLIKPEIKTQEQRLISSLRDTKVVAKEEKSKNAFVPSAKYLYKVENL